MIGIDLAAADEKKKAEKLGTDLIGITQMSRFEGATKPMDACYIFPDAKSIFVLTFRIPLGALRIIEKGTLFSKYPSMGYAVLNQVYSPMALWNFTRYQKDHSYETVLMLNANGGEAIYTATGMFRKGWSRSERENNSHPDVLVHFRLAAYMAGLGELGYGKVFLTPQFGPRQRFVLLFTDADLDPIMKANFSRARSRVVSASQWKLLWRKGGKLKTEN